MTRIDAYAAAARASTFALAFMLIAPVVAAALVRAAQLVA
jgi:hypothetical protein